MIGWYLKQNIRFRVHIGYLIAVVLAGGAGYIGAKQGPGLLILLSAVALAVVYSGSVFTSNSFSKVIESVRKASEQLEQGNLKAAKVEGASLESRMLNDAFGGMVASIKRSIDDAEMLAAAMTAGQLDVRADAEQHHGEFKALIGNLNGSLDAVIGPLNLAAEYVEKIGKGEIPDKITETYNGDFNEIVNNLNYCIDGLGGLVESSNVLKRLSTNDYTLEVKGRYQGIYKETAKSVNLIRAILLLMVEANEKISSGDFKEHYEMYAKWGKRCEEDRLIPSYLMLMENIMRLVDDANMMVDGAVAGKLDVRADVTRHQGEYRRVIEGFNNTMDAVIGPLNVAAEYVERIGQGDIPPKITDSYNGDFNEIVNNLNYCIDGLGGLAESTAVLAKMAVNDYTDKVEGNYQGIYARTAEGVNTVRTRLLAVVQANTQIAAGDFMETLELFREVGKRSEADMLLPSFIMSMENLLRLVDDANMMVDGAVAGKLDVRADATQHQGEYRKVIEGFNKTMDAVIGPLNVAAEYVERIGQGEIPPKITDSYNGDFNEIVNNLNFCIDGLGGLAETSAVLKLMAENDYTVKVEGNYQGIYAETASDVNAVQSRVLAMIVANERIAAGDFIDIYHAYKKVGKRGENDRLIPSYLQMIETIIAIIDGVEMLGNAAVEGQLDVRADETKFHGEFLRVVRGFNNTMDAVIGPLKMAAEYIERIAAGDTPPKITNEYKGGFNEIKNNLNTCIDAITIMVDEVGVAISAGVEGRLDQRADAERCQGVYHKILAGVNATMDALIAPINEAIIVLNEVNTGSLNLKMNGDYLGDNALLKDNLNSTIITLDTLRGEIAETLLQLSRGNLDINIDQDFPGDFSSISTAEKSIINSLNEIMSDINHAAEQVAGGSRQVSDSSQALAQGANEQASAIQELTAAITEIAAQTKQNATNANQANELALNARDNAAQGNEQMQEMLGAMEEINDSSANISKIIKVIDEIAFQTNILALNAAVEAARAGQHGKGFAVVAEEVRNLAARSASAAKETTDLIEGSIRKVQAGTKIANDTAQALNRIVDGISQASVLVGDIAVASNEQATGIAQVDQGISQVSQVVQTNSATAEESAAASEELSEQANLLKERVVQFKLRGSRSAKNAAPAPSHREDLSSYRPAINEAAAFKTKISLDDDFGKY
jgi:methyl-accepting chemotaxis protein